MARLLDWPSGLGISSFQWLSGPRAINATTTETIKGVTQTVESAFGAWSFQVTFAPLQRDLSRRHRGWIGALQGGANATRFTFIDGDRIYPAQTGVNAPEWQRYITSPWSSGKRWSNGAQWKGAFPLVSVAAAAALGATQISLADSFWGHKLDIGDFTGFTPFHFGLYQITEVIDAGVYRIWPPLRAALTTDSFATLQPVMAVRLMGAGAAQVQHDAQAAQNMTASFVEVFDYDVRDYFADVYSKPAPSPAPPISAVGDFTTQFYKRGGHRSSTSSAFQLSRVSTAAYFDASGKMVTAAANELRIDHDPVTGDALGALIEGEAKNYITNNTMAGAESGAPGKLPDDWIASLNGLSQEVVGFSQSDGIDYIDLRLKSDLDLTGLTFSRASTATYFDEAGVLQTAAADVLRDAYDPITHDYLGKIVEGSAATNLLEHDEEFDSTFWFKTGCSVTADAANGVDGTATMDKIVEDTSTGTHFVTAVVAEAITGGTQCTAAIDLKKGERTHAAVALMNNSASPFENAAVFIDLETGEASMTPSGVTSAAFGIEQLPNGIWRVWVTCVMGSTVTQPSLVVWTSDGTTTSYAGDGASGIYLDRAQLEVGTMPTSFVKTTDAIATRAADVLSISNTELGWETDALAVEFVGRALPGWNFINFGQFDDGTFNQLGTFRWAIASTGAAFYVQEPGGTEYTVWANATLDMTQPVTARFFWSGTTIGVSVNGGEFATYTMSVPASDFGFTRFILGAGSWFAQAGAIIESVKIIPNWAVISMNAADIYASGITATASIFAQIIAGSTANTEGVLLVNRAYLSDGVGFNDESIAIDNGGASLTTSRFEVANAPTGTPTGAGQLEFGLIGVTGEVDITLRIGLPQMERGSVASSAIKTTSAAVTRAADTLTLNATGGNDWTLTFDDGSHQVFSGVDGNLVLTRDRINRGHVTNYIAKIAG